jgi:hypothetical protein
MTVRELPETIVKASIEGGNKGLAWFLRDGSTAGGERLQKNWSSGVWAQKGRPAGVKTRLFIALIGTSKLVP